MACPDLLKAAVLSTISILVVPLEASADTCQPANSFANMPIFIAVALIGAAVGGLLARQRKEELKRLNNQLRQINTALRRQAQIESFAPGLTYAPVGRTIETNVIVDPRKQELVVNLRNGKNYLRNQDLDKAVVEFSTALELADSIGDRFEEKKAARGLGASLQRLGKYREAMRYYSKVLELSKETGEDSGCTEAYGAIADCYSEIWREQQNCMTSTYQGWSLATKNSPFLPNETMSSFLLVQFSWAGGFRFSSSFSFAGAVELIPWF